MKATHIRQWSPVFAVLIATALLVGCPATQPGPRTGPRRGGFDPSGGLTHSSWKKRVEAAELLGEQTTLRSLALLQRAVGDPDPRVRAAVISALARRRDRSSLPKIIKALSDPDTRIRKAAVQALGELGDVRALDVLIQRLTRVEQEEQLQIMFVLHRLVHRGSARTRAATVRRLIQIIRTGGGHAFRAASALLPRLGSHIVDPVIAVLVKSRRAGKGRDPGSQSLEHIVATQSKVVLPALLKILDGATNKPLHARIAADILARQGAVAVKPLVERLDWMKTRSLRTARLAEEILARIGAPAVPALTALLKHRTLAWRKRGATVLSRIKDQRSAPALIQLLQREQDAGLRFLCVRALGASGSPRAAPAILTALQRETITVTPLTAVDWIAYRQALVRLKPTTAALAEALRQRKSHVRLVAAAVAAKLRRRGLTKPLLKVLGDRDPAVAGAAARALGAAGDRAAVPKLILKAMHPNAGVKAAVIQALGRLGDKRALFSLLFALKAKNTAVQIHALVALVRLKNRAAVGAVRRLALQPFPAVRRAARWALAKLTGKPQRGKSPVVGTPTPCSLLVDRLRACGKGRTKGAPSPDNVKKVRALCPERPPDAASACLRTFTCAQCAQCVQKLEDWRQGRVIRWWNLAKRRKREELVYVNGARQGLYRRWYKSGKLHSRGLYLRGKRNGVWTLYHANGKRASVTSYLMDRKSGLHQAWHVNGKRRAFGTYLRDKKHGVWMTFSPAGKLTRRCTYAFRKPPVCKP